LNQYLEKRLIMSGAFLLVKPCFRIGLNQIQTYPQV